MKKNLCYLFFFFWFVTPKPVEATFSIVAIDPITGEVGSAGASCIGNSQIINDPIGAIGAINTQALYNLGNQLYAHSLMEMGLSPQEIIDSLIANDAQGNPGVRQYGIVDLVGGGRSAAHTGAFTFDWKGHLLGTTYAIQGNILLGSGILDSMEFIFLITPGPLCDRLMAALEAAKAIGADTRCLSLNKSSISAFIHIVRPDSTDYPYLIVANTPANIDPIDSLRVLYDAWKDTLTGIDENELLEKNYSLRLFNSPNPFTSSTFITFTLPGKAGNVEVSNKVSLKIFDITGQLVSTLIDQEDMIGINTYQWNGLNPSGEIASSGIYFMRLAVQDGSNQPVVLTKKTILLR